MYKNKREDELRNIYESIKKDFEPTIEQLLKDIKNNPIAYLKAVLKKENLNDVISEYADSVDKEDPDLLIFITTLSQILNKGKDE